MADMTPDERIEGDLVLDLYETKGDLNRKYWRGMPEFRRAADRISLSLAFDSPEDRDALLRELARLGGVRQVPMAKKTGNAWSARWPPREQEDLSALRFDFEEGGPI